METDKLRIDMKYVVMDFLFFWFEKWLSPQSWQIDGNFKPINPF